MQIGAADSRPRVPDEDPTGFDGGGWDGVDADGAVAVEAEGPHGCHYTFVECL